MSARWMIGAAIVLFVSIAAASAQSGDVRPRDPEWTAPPDRAARSNPLADRPELAAGGRKVYLQRCSTCHGDEGLGTAKGPALADAAVQAQSDGALFWKISSGNTRGGMPAFSFLPEPQRWQLVLRLRTLSPGGDKLAQ